jgi:hypothetical protein
MKHILPKGLDTVVKKATKHNEDRLLKGARGASCTVE